MPPNLDPTPRSGCMAPIGTAKPKTGGEEQWAEHSCWHRRRNEAVSPLKKHEIEWISYLFSLFFLWWPPQNNENALFSKLIELEGDSAAGNHNHTVSIISICERLSSFWTEAVKQPGSCSDCGTASPYLTHLVSRPAKTQHLIFSLLLAQKEKN